MKTLKSSVLDVPAAALSWLGRQGTRAIATLVIVGIAVPPAGTFLKPYLTEAVLLGFMASQRNMGLVLVATNGALPDLTWLYFALSQFPIYPSPQLLQPLVRRIRAS
ncbi:MAG: hypothetical protein Q8R67_00190 [Rhodoferax sp.]|nr:hypothetical protein [Rhodoferax sp.]MDP3650074.1 hypothetical protein [Rhodoferax sp.]